MPETRPPSGESDEREVDYLICRQCNTPCYIFEMDGSRISEAQCLVCGNDTVRFFALGEEAGSEEND